MPPDMATETQLQMSDALHAYTGGELPTMQDLFREQQENKNPQPTADALSKSAPALRKDQALSFKRNVRTIRQSVKDVNASVQSDAFGSTSFSPSPALELRWCIGYTSQPAGNMLWTSDSRSIIYSCSTNVICMNPDKSYLMFHYVSLFGIC